MEGIIVLLAVIAGLIASTVITIGYLTVKKLKELIQKRKEKSRESKVVFGAMGKIVEKDAREILANAPSMSMEELERICEETPYFVVDYDPNTDEVSDYTTIKTECTDEKIKSIIEQNDGIILFD